jgi:hypothetical protein
MCNNGIKSKTVTHLTSLKICDEKHSFLMFGPRLFAGRLRGYSLAKEPVQVIVFEPRQRRNSCNHRL